MTVSEDKKNRTDNSNTFKTGKVVVLSASHFIHDVYSSFLSPLLPLLIEKFSMTLGQAGFLSTIMQIPALFNPFIGMLADRISVRFLIILAPVTTAVPMSLLGLAPSYTILLLLLFITGISTAMFHVPSPVMISHLSGNKKGKGMSFYMTGGEFARTIGPMVAIGAVSLSSLEGYYPVMVFGIMASVWLFFKFRDIPIQIEKSERQPLLSTCREMGHILLPLTAIIIARGFMHASMTTFLPTFLNQETGSLWLAGIGLTAIEGVGVAGILCSGTLSDRFGRKRILAISLFVAPLSMLLFIGTNGFLRILMLLITGFMLLSTTPIMLAMVQENAKNSPAAANGLFMMVSFIARSGIVIFVGVIGDHIGLRSTYAICAIMGLFGIPFIFLIKGKN
jgi:MFS transporter, FSR family, fosmidomycin resistance protein